MKMCLFDYDNTVSNHVSQAEHPESH